MPQPVSRALVVFAAGLCASAALARPTSFLGVAAGDADATSVVVWTRAVDSAAPTTPLSLTLQLSPDASFSSIAASVAATTDPAARDSVAKTLVTGLTPGTAYYYRFVAPDQTVSPVGRLKTAPASSARVAVRFGFSGDCDGQWRPYSSTINFASLNLDAFIFIGDTIYETTTSISPAAFVPSATNNTLPAADIASIVNDYRRKYREQFAPTPSGTFPGLTGMFAAQSNYTLLDNHELGNRQYINGGAPANAVNGDLDTAKDANTTGTFMNRNGGFAAFVQAYKDYQPIREDAVSAPSDPRTDGTLSQYRAVRWGKNVAYIQLDDRSYRDIRLKKSPGNADDAGPRADNPNRTMLGATQRAWLQQTLLDAKANGVTWKIISISSPIDQLGQIGSGLDGGKSWMGGYRAERNTLMRFLKDNGIKNVVFLSTDDHQARVNELGYFDDITQQSTYHRLDRVYSIVAGPIGAGGPDAVTNHTFSNIQALANAAVTAQGASVEPLGIDPASPYLFNVRREGDPSANTARGPVDFYSPDTFNYAVLGISADGGTLDVSVQGINSYAANTFPEPSAANPVREIFGFSLVARGACDADVSGNGVVDMADLNAVLSAFGSVGSGIPGDVDGDGAVTFLDLNLVLTNFGRSC